MISMSTVESIRQKYRNGMSITQICREEKVDYKTVVKYIAECHPPQCTLYFYLN
jgi:transposase-like protein